MFLNVNQPISFLSSVVIFINLVYKRLLPILLFISRVIPKFYYLNFCLKLLSSYWFDFRSSEHRHLFASFAGLEGRVHQATRLRKPEQSRSLFRPNLLGPERKFIRSCGIHYSQQVRCQIILRLTVDLKVQMHSTVRVVGQILLKGVLGLVRKSRGPLFRVILHFYVTIFQTLPHCVHLC